MNNTHNINDNHDFGNDGTDINEAINRIIKRAKDENEALHKLLKKINDGDKDEEEQKNKHITDRKF